MHSLTKLSNRNVLFKSCEIIGASSQVFSSSKNYSDDVRFLTKLDSASLKRGRGGRSSFSGKVATIFGATGFMGRYLCNSLGKTGTQMVIPYRGDPYYAMHLRLMGDLGQILFLPFHLCDDESIRKAVKYSNVVINLVGRDYETRNFSFHQVNVEGAQRIARISKEAGVEKFIHISALNSNMEHEGYHIPGGSEFLRTKAESEEAVKKYYPDAIIFRPSDVYGQQDRFLFYYCRVPRYQWPFLPLPYAGNGIWKQPVYVGDLAQGIQNAVFDHNAVGTTYEAVGPRRYELGELMDYFNNIMWRTREWGYKRYDMKWDPFYKLRFVFNKFNPSYPLGTLVADKLEREAVTDTTFDLPGLEDLGVELTNIEDRIHWELAKFRASGYYNEKVGEFEKAAPPKFVLP